MADDARADGPESAPAGGSEAQSDDARTEDLAGDGPGVPVVALDASALMAPVEADLRLFEELDRLLGGYEAAVPTAVLAELDGLQGGNGAEATAASVGADLAERAEAVETDESYADDALVALAAAGRVDAVVTVDGPLAKRVLAVDAPVIGLRGRNTLAITEP
ncbi:Vapc superfamily-like protein [Halorubrum californiense DSM 19288]|uniref:Vapc superfamily-like protein n=1 Tax=Halorubrum californiense DSM 19288 TaxID=1227465 RepID=M0EI18_9EURY|nr:MULTISPECIES: Vapc superfamily-like protein [Halorubrum]ELZ46723.1 Vapc superfamily-like protein [Halorubrum californiense DSM 19288]TKX67843.1 twitching motility protein PilT [Halorubrum sp. GN11GM_10-3_MGM]